MSSLNIYTPNLMGYLDEHYETSNLMKSVQNVNEKELIRINNIIDDIAKQFAISTATWGLSLWEFEYGIITDNTKTYDQRREVVLAKHRGQGTTTVEMLKSVSEAYSNGEVDIIEIFGMCKFIVKFVGIKGIPEQLAELDKTISQIKPCHLAHEYQYTYNTWGMVKNKTWGEMKNLTWLEAKTHE